MEAIDNNLHPNPKQPPTEILGELIEFDGRFYLQKQGTAMGTKMAPSYANLFMGKLELRLLQLGTGNILLWSLMTYSWSGLTVKQNYPTI